MTHVLPLVNTKFRSIYTRSEYLWKTALIRLVTNKQDLWGDAMVKFLYRPRTLSQNANDNVTYTQEILNGDESNVFPFLELSRTYYERGDISAEKIVTDAGSFMEQILEQYDGYFTIRRREQQRVEVQIQRSHSIYMELYRHILSQYIKYTSPLFYMPDQIQIGNEFGIHFFEPRYRLLIAEVMEPFPQSYRRGADIMPLISKLLYNHNQPFQRRSSPHPTFIYANNSPLKQNSVVTIVNVRQCSINPNNTADVFLNPIAYGRIEHVWERPNSHRLYEAKIIRMDEAECYAYEQESYARFYAQPRQGINQNANEYIQSMMLQLIQAANDENNMDDE